MYMAQVAQGATAVAPTNRVAIPQSPNPNITLAVSITGGTSRTVRFQAAFNRAGPWFDVGTSRTTAGTFLETIPAVPFVRLNISANAGSTVDAWVAR